MHLFFMDDLKVHADSLLRLVTDVWRGKIRFGSSGRGPWNEEVYGGTHLRG